MMHLSDPERKLLAILRNNSTSKHRVPSLHLLQAKTGRDEAGLRKVLQGLADKGYVKWSPEQPVDAVEPGVCGVCRIKKSSPGELLIISPLKYTLCCSVGWSFV